MAQGSFATACAASTFKTGPAACKRWQSLLATDWAFLTQTQQGRGPLWCALATLLGPAGPFPQIQGTGCCCCCFTRQTASAKSHTMLCGVALHTGRAASAWRDRFLSASLRSRCKEQTGSSCAHAAEGGCKEAPPPRPLLSLTQRTLPPRPLLSLTQRTPGARRRRGAPAQQTPR